MIVIIVQFRRVGAGFCKRGEKEKEHSWLAFCIDRDLSVKSMYGGSSTDLLLAMP
jgi:hypothetical protein